MGWVYYFKTCTGNCNHAFGSPNLVLPCNEVFPFPSFLYGQVFHWSWWPCHLASLLEKKGYKAIRVINSKKKIDGLFLLFSFNSWQLILCFVFAYSLKSVSFHLLTICVSFSFFTSSSLVAGFPRLTTWSGYSSPLWLSLKLWVFKKRIKYLWYDPFSYLLTKKLWT